MDEPRRLQRGVVVTVGPVVNRYPYRVIHDKVFDSTLVVCLSGHTARHTRSLKSPVFSLDDAFHTRWQLELLFRGAPHPSAPRMVAKLMNKDQPVSFLRLQIRVKVGTDDREEGFSEADLNVVPPGTWAFAVHGFDPFESSESVALTLHIRAFVHQTVTLPTSESRRDFYGPHTWGVTWSMFSDYGTLFNKPSYSDITLAFENGVTMPGHKVILASRPGFFDSAFHFNFIRGTPVDTLMCFGELEAVEAVLHYMYTGRLRRLTYELAIHLMDTSNMYQVFEVKKICSEYLGQRLTADNVLALLAYARLHNEPYLSEQCMYFVHRHRHEVAPQGEWGATLDRAAVDALNCFLDSIPGPEDHQMALEYRF